MDKLTKHWVETNAKTFKLHQSKNYLWIVLGITAFLLNCYYQTWIINNM